MSRRRRKKNPLLARIIWISILAHLIILPILGYFVGFKKIGQAIMGPQVVIMPPPKFERTQPEVHHMQKQQSKRAAAKNGGQHKAAPVAKNNVPQPKVVASNVKPGESDTSNTIANPNGTPGFKPGTVPTEVAPRTNPPATTEAHPAPPQPAVKPEPARTEPAPKPHVPVITEVATTFNPSPVIPDDLRNDALDANVTAQFMVDTSGVPGDVRIVKSSGNDELDRLALEAARKWRFKPATRDGQPIESRVILHIQFEVQ